MKLGIMADSHDNRKNIKKAVELFNEHKVELVIHAGDFTSVSSLSLLQNLNMKMLGIFGNNDVNRVGLAQKSTELGFELYNDPYTVELEGRRFSIFHDPLMIDDGIVKVANHDILIYGHTHKFEIKREGNSLLINPGETAGLLENRNSIVILELGDLSHQVLRF
ncbi:MAG: metallophosphoesterase [Candidatus Tectomicrobia bacterium]|nr:metallophosphoesterase [Candidatus Tectomicrobia bacterium]